MLFPFVYGFAFFIDWIINGVFPLDIFIIWIISIVGLMVASAGASMKEAHGMGWFQRHLNWTWLFAYLIWMPPNASESGMVSLVATIFLLLVSGWIIKQKRRSLWWILLAFIFSPLWLKSKRG